MASTRVTINRPFDEAWIGLQKIETWRGVAGIDEISSPTYSASMDLESFTFAIDTPVGRVHDRAKVITSRSDQAGQLSIDVDQKGVRIRITVNVSASLEQTAGNVDVSASATSFLSKPLASTLRAVLAGSIHREAAMIVSRLES